MAKQRRLFLILDSSKEACYRFRISFLHASKRFLFFFIWNKVICNIASFLLRWWLFSFQFKLLSICKSWKIKYSFRSFVRLDWNWKKALLLNSLVVVRLFKLFVWWFTKSWSFSNVRWFFFWINSWEIWRLWRNVLNRRPFLVFNRFLRNMVKLQFCNFLSRTLWGDANHRMIWIWEIVGNWRELVVNLRGNLFESFQLFVVNYESFLTCGLFGVVLTLTSRPASVIRWIRVVGALFKLLSLELLESFF